MGLIVRTALAVMLLGTLACGGGDGGTTGPDDTQIRASVLADGSPLSGATVRLYASGGTSALEEDVTNSGGRVTFADLEPGTYDVEVVVPEGLEMDAPETARRAVGAASGTTAEVTFRLITPLPADVRVVTLEAASFSPSAVTIDAGMTIRWVNGAAVSHTVTPDGHSEWASQSMSTDGQVFEHTFNNEGSYPYVCQLHAGMTGTITVN